MKASFKQPTPWLSAISHRNLGDKSKHIGWWSSPTAECPTTAPQNLQVHTLLTDLNSIPKIWNCQPTPSNMAIINKAYGSSIINEPYMGYPYYWSPFPRPLPALKNFPQPWHRCRRPHRAPRREHIALPGSSVESEKLLVIGDVVVKSNNFHSQPLLGSSIGRTTMVWPACFPLFSVLLLVSIPHSW